MPEFYLINDFIEKLEKARDDKENARITLLDLLSETYCIDSTGDEDDYTKVYGTTDLIDACVMLLEVVRGSLGRADQYVLAFNTIISGIQADKGKMV